MSSAVVTNISQHFNKDESISYYNIINGSMLYMYIDFNRFRWHMCERYGSKQKLLFQSGNYLKININNTVNLAVNFVNVSIRDKITTSVLVLFTRNPHVILLLIFTNVNI